jgi:elongation factor G
MAKKKVVEKVELDSVRNIGIAAHIDAGKTTLTERILFYTGASHKIGEVHDGAATMDFMAEEKAHGITIGSAVTRCPWDGHLVQIVDTPGHVDFTIEVERAMRVLDGAVIVMDAVRGVEPQTETVWRQASRFDIPRCIFVNKMDRPGASYQRCMDTLAKRLDGHPVPVCVPVEDGRVIDLINEEVVSFSGDRGQDVTRGPVPADLQDLLQEHRETMLLAAAEFDEELEEAVLMEEAIDPEAVWSALRKGLLEGKVHAFFGGSALRNWGIQPLLDGILKLMPNPLERPAAIAHEVVDGEQGEETFIEMTPDGPLAALAFKVQLWEGRRHVFVRVYQGILNSGDTIRIGGRDETERVARVFQVDAGRKKRVDGATAGEIVLLAGLRKATTGDTICAVDTDILLERIDTKEPVLGLAVEPESSRDEDKMLEVMAKICEEDPTVRFEEDTDTGQRILKGMGELHLQIIFERIEREFGLKVRAGKPRVMIRETIAGPGKGDATVDRTLRAGEANALRLHARAAARVAPRGRDEGMEVEVEPTILPAGATLSAAQREAVEAGVNDATLGGPSEGAPLQDVKVRLLTVEIFGEGSSPQALRIAASQAVREAMLDGGGQVLRPLMTVEVVSPDENLGTVLGDLQSRGATILGQESDMGMSSIHGECPLQALLGYATQLRSITKGRGQFTMDFARFDVG